MIDRFESSDFDEAPSFGTEHGMDELIKRSQGILARAEQLSNEHRKLCAKSKRLVADYQKLCDDLRWAIQENEEEDN